METRQNNSSNEANSSNRTLWLIVLIVWFVLSLLIAAQRYSFFLQTDPNIRFHTTLLWSLFIWSFWALATPIIFKLGREFPLKKQHWHYTVLLHILFSLFFAVLHIGFFSFLSSSVWLNPNSRENFYGAFINSARIFLYVEFIFYWAILGAGTAHDAYRKARERELQTKELETQLGLAKLQTLKMQIQPHFLFNALNTVSMLVRNNENNQAVQMIAGLGDLLRSSLDGNSTQFVSLSSELDFIKRYLAIEQFRFSDRLQIEIDVPDELLSAKVPNLILQPLVENSIKHGIAKTSSARSVRISARKENETLELCVQDDGAGFSSDCDDEDKQGIGLKNTRIRLSHLYGNEQEMILQNAEKTTGAIVKLKIPYRVSDGKD